MFDKLIAILTGAENSSADGDLQVQVAALLVEAAIMDSRFDVEERETIKRSLAARFDVFQGK